MPSPRTTADSKPKPLSDTEVQQISAEIAEGKPPMVWFTSAAVGVTRGKSGKVVALGDPADEDFLQVRPTGSKDVLSFSRTEVTLTKPPRDKPAAQAKSGAEKSVPAADKESGAPATRSNSTPEPANASEPRKASPAPSRAPDPARTTHNGVATNATSNATKPNGAVEQPAASAKSRKPSAARKAKGPDITVTLTGTIDGDWTVDVTTGKKRAVRALPVASSAVAQASKLLHSEVAEVVDDVLDAARGAQQAKVEQLQAELEQAKRTLEDLSD